MIVPMKAFSTGVHVSNTPMWEEKINPIRRKLCKQEGKLFRQESRCFSREEKDVEDNANEKKAFSLWRHARLADEQQQLTNKQLFL